MDEEVRDRKVDRRGFLACQAHGDELRPWCKALGLEADLGFWGIGRHLSAIGRIVLVCQARGDELRQVCSVQQPKLVGMYLLAW